MPSLQRHEPVTREPATLTDIGNCPMRIDDVLVKRTTKLARLLGLIAQSSQTDQQRTLGGHLLVDVEQVPVGTILESTAVDGGPTGHASGVLKTKGDDGTGLDRLGRPGQEPIAGPDEVGELVHGAELVSTDPHGGGATRHRVALLLDDVDW